MQPRKLLWGRDCDEVLLIKQKKKMERTSYFAFRHDGLSIENHSHLMTVNVLYDPASSLSDEQYYLKYKKYKCTSYYRRVSVVSISEVSYSWSWNALLWGEDNWSFQNAKANPMSQWCYYQWYSRFSKGILQIASLKLANKREEVSFVHLVPCIQTMVKTYASQIQKKWFHCKIELRQRNQNNVTD